MKTFSITYTIKFMVKFAPHYVWNQYNELFNIKTGRRIKQVRSGGSIGYIIDNKFYSCAKIKREKLVIKPPKIECPF